MPVFVTEDNGRTNHKRIEKFLNFFTRISFELQGESCEIDGKYDNEDFQSLMSAMQVLGFSSDEQDTIFRILASGKTPEISIFLQHYHFKAEILISNALFAQCCTSGTCISIGSSWSTDRKALKLVPTPKSGGQAICCKLMSTGSRWRLPLKRP